MRRRTTAFSNRPSRPCAIRAITAVGTAPYKKNICSLVKKNVPDHFFFFSTHKSRANEKVTNLGLII